MDNKRSSRWGRKAIAMLLAVCMGVSAATPVSALSWGSSSGGSLISWLKNWFSGNSTPGMSTTLVEDESTVSDSTVLRAATYVAENGETIKPFKATLFNYDVDTINQYIANREVADAVAKGVTDFSNWEWQGLYFSNGNPGKNNDKDPGYYTGSYTSETSSYQAASSVTYRDLANSNVTNAATNYYYKSGSSYYPVTVTRTSSTESSDIYTNQGKKNYSDLYSGRNTPYYYLDTATGQYYQLTITRNKYYGKNYYTIQYTKNGNTVTLVNGQRNATASFDVYTKSTGSVTRYTYTLYANGKTISTNTVTDTSAAYSANTLYVRSAGTTYSATSSGYADWNYWPGNLSAFSSNAAYRSYIYSGLVANRLDENGNIQFTTTSANIFDASDTSNKEVYTNVGIPFTYDSSTGHYTFDSDDKGAYFANGAANNTDLTLLDYPMVIQNTSYKSGEENGYSYSSSGWYNAFMPFNTPNYGYASTGLSVIQKDSFSAIYNQTGYKVYNTQNYTAGSTEGRKDYHFGMKVTISFTMTNDGKIVQGDETSDDIVFNFTGDDDVWVFVDNVLVLDLGGIHDCAGGSINFAENTINFYGAADRRAGDMRPVAEGGYGSAYSNTALLSQGHIFNDGINQDYKFSQSRESFAAKNEHTLTIYYVERGAGVSNCEISFNLPQRDNLSVSKNVPSTDSEGAAIDSELMTRINNKDFGFTLYKNGEVVADAPYSVYNASGSLVKPGSTDTNGHFVLKNGYTATFYGITLTSSDEYKVVEDDPGAAYWTTPSWSGSIIAANGSLVNGSSLTSFSNQAGYESPVVVADGSDEATDKIVLLCTNVYKHQNVTSVQANDDRIVIDYGLAVNIDALNNDIPSANANLTLQSVTGAEYGEATIVNNQIHYQLTSQLTGVEVLTYTVQATDKTTSSDTASSTARIYIIPATTMYYEENFTDLVTFTDGSSSGWSPEGTAQTDLQEPGVVGTIGDSPYGTDKAYLENTSDSYGTSMYVNTADGAATFEYTFTGRGTSFFARTSDTSGYMWITITDEEGNEIYNGFRNTIYTSDTETTLYNIPVFTYMADNYGTYTVLVRVLKGNVIYGSEFWLDGIRVYAPLDADDANYQIAISAYSDDGENNCSIVTLREKLITDNTTYLYETDDNGELILDEDDCPIPVCDENGDPVIIWGDQDEQNGFFVVFTDTNGEIISADEYRSNGPKEEVYLNKGQSVSFSLVDFDRDESFVYLGIKAPSGSGQVSINGDVIAINNTTDCYYDISESADIITDADGVQTAVFKIKAESALISVTTIKVTGSYEFSIVSGNVDVVPEGDDVIVEDDIDAQTEKEDAEQLSLFLSNEERKEEME